MFIVLKTFKHSHMDTLEMDGRGPHFHIIEEDIGNGPVQLIVDKDLQEIFWSDAQLNKISFTDYDGTFLFHIPFFE